jgi:hypothetical protein
MTRTYQALDDISVLLLEKTLEVERMLEDRNRERAEREQIRQIEAEEVARAFAAAKFEKLALEQLLDEERAAQVGREDEWRRQLEGARRQGGKLGKDDRKKMAREKTPTSDIEETKKQMEDLRREQERVAQEKADLVTEREAVKAEREELWLEITMERNRLANYSRKRWRSQARVWAGGKARIREQLAVVQVWRVWLCHHLRCAKR